MENNAQLITLLGEAATGTSVILNYPGLDWEMISADPSDIPHGHITTFLKLDNGK
jgi:hypothetical protein